MAGESSSPRTSCCVHKGYVKGVFSWRRRAVKNIHGKSKHWGGGGVGGEEENKKIKKRFLIKA